MKKILITGATGFIGSHLVEYLVKKKFNVVAFDVYNSFNKWGWLENSKYKNKFEVILGDIREYDSVKKAAKNCSSIIHLAALIGIPYSYVSPLAYIKTNVIGTYNVLETARENEIQNIIITSTSEVYGSSIYEPINETHPVKAQSPYAASKISADELALSYYRSFNLPVKIIRPFNTYGPRQSARAVIPSIINQCLDRKRKFIEIGNDFTFRDFTFVSDLCDAYFKVQKSKLYGQIINVGSNSKISIKELVKSIQKITKTNKKILTKARRQRPDLSEVKSLKCDNTFAIKKLKWKVKNSLNTGLKKTVYWSKEYKNMYKDIYNI